MVKTLNGQTKINIFFDFEESHDFCPFYEQKHCFPSHTISQIPARRHTLATISCMQNRACTDILAYSTLARYSIFSVCSKRLARFSSIISLSRRPGCFTSAPASTSESTIESARIAGSVFLSTTLL